MVFTPFWCKSYTILVLWVGDGLKMIYKQEKKSMLYVIDLKIKIKKYMNNGIYMVHKKIIIDF